MRTNRSKSLRLTFDPTYRRSSVSLLARKLFLSPFLGALIACFAVVSAQALPIITNVAETGGDNEATDTIVAKWTGITFTNGVAGEPITGKAVDAPYTVGLFGDKAPMFVDRNHLWVGAATNLAIPSYLVGGEYIMSGNDNRDNTNYVLRITVSSPAIVYMLIDSRLEDGTSTNPPAAGRPISAWTNMAWMKTNGFAPVLTGANPKGDKTAPDEVGVDEGGDGTINQTSAVYSKTVAAGSVTTIYQADNAGQNMYGVVVTMAPDITPPSVASASTLGDPSSITVRFSEPVASASALNPGNYFINNGATITSVVAGANSSTVTLKVSPLNLSLSYSLFVKDVMDMAAKPNTLAPNPSLAIVDTFQGRLFVETFTNITGTAVSALTGAASFIANKPTSTETITSFQYTPASLENYGARVTGYVIAPETGNYVFFLSADDNAELYLSTDESPANKKLIARETVWSNARQWTTSGGSSDLNAKRSDRFAASQWPGGGASLTLTAGQRYYVEALVKEGTGGDQISVGWRLPSHKADPANDSPAIAGAFLAIPVGPVSILQQPANTAVAEQASGVLSVVASGAPPYTYQWSSNGVAIAGATGATLPITSAKLAQSGAIYSVKVSNGFSSATSSDSTLTVTADTTPATLVSAVGSGTLNTVALVFSEAITSATANSAANYAVSGGVTVTSATLGADAKSVLLITSAQTPGTAYTLTVNGIKDTSTAGNTIAADSQASFTGWVLSPGFLLREVYLNTGSGTDVTNLTTAAKFPYNPDVAQYVSAFETPSAFGDNFGQRVSGYLIPPLTGNYVFYLCSDDRSALLLSTDENPANKVQIAREPEWNDSRQWLATTRRTATNAENKSVSIPLVAGRRYYVEALHKEGGGGDNLGVTWMLPNQTNAPANGSAPIGSQYIATYANPAGATITITTQPQSVTVAEAPTAPAVTLTVAVNARNASSTSLPVVYQWQKNGADIAGANSASYTTPGLLPADNGAKYRVIISAPAATATSQEAVVTVTRDTTAPRVVSANTFTRPNNATVVFSEAVSDRTATNVANYAVTGQTISSAVKTAPNVVELTYGTVAPTAPAATGPTTNETLLVGINATQMWRYENSGSDLGTAWKEKAFNDAAWPQGPALLAFETGATAEPIRTQLKRTNSAGVFIKTDYFRTRFTFNGDATKAKLMLRHVIDDGVALYLNGTEVYRFFLPAGALTAATDADPTDHENAWEGPFEIPATALVAGENVLAAELHQRGTSSSDAVFGMELKAITVTGAAPAPAPVVATSPTIFEFNFNEGSGTAAASADGKLVGTLTTTNTPATLATFSTDTPSGLNGDYSMQFAMGQKITVPDPSRVLQLETNNPSFTVEAWLKFATPSARAVFFFNQAAGGRVSASVFTNRTGFVTTLGILDVPSKAAIPDDGNWHHYAVVHENGKELRFYVDGTLGDTVPYTRSVSFNTSPTNQTFYIGSEPTGGLQFVGNIDRLRYSKAALAPADLDSAAIAKNAPIAYEGFNYPIGNLLNTQGGLGWANAWQTNGSPATSSVVVAGGLGYTDTAGNTLLVSGNKAHLTGAPGTSQPNRDIQTGMRGADNTTTWLSFLGQRMGPTTNVTANIYPRGCNISLFSNTVERLAIGNGSGAPADTWALLPAGSLANVQASSSSFSQLSLIVVRIDHKAGNDDAFLFVNPPLGIEPSIASAAAKSTNAFDFTFNRIRPFAGGNDAANSRPYAELDIDEIRVGNTFGAVTPFSVGKKSPGSPGIGNGLMAYWNFDGNLADSAKSLHGVARGPVPVAFVDGQPGFGKAIQLNGTNFVEIPGSATTLQFASNSVSIAGWFKVGTFDKGWQALISKGENLNYRIARRSTTNTIAYAGGVGEGADDVPTITNGWHHFVAVTDAAGAKFGSALYIDGVLRSVNTNKAVLAAGVSNLFIGENPDSRNRQWNGLIDDVALWNRVLTAEEVSALYSGGTGRALSGLLPPSASRTYSIGLNFGAEEANGTGTGTITANEVAGLPGIAQANWNSLRGASGAASGVTADNGNRAEATGTIVQWNSANTWSSTGRSEENNKFATNANRAILTGYLDTGNATTTTVSILGVPTALTANGYDVYVYALGGVGGRGGSYRIVEANTRAVLKDYVRGQSPANPTDFVEIPAVPGSTNHAAGTYLVFKGLKAANITIEATTAGGLGFSGTPRAPINAVQLVAPPTVAIPSALALTVNGIQDTAEQANTIAANTQVVVGTAPAYPADFGTIVNGFQDDFNASTLNLNWKVRGPATNIFRLNNGFLSVTNGTGDPNHLLYEAAGYDKTNQEVLVRIRINQFGSGDPVRAGVGVAVSGDAANQGINYHFRDEGANAVHTEFLDDARSWGPELPYKWQSNVWYWVRLKYAPNTATGQPDAFAKIWQADGTVAEPSDWQSTWDRHPAEARIRSGFAGITGGSAAGVSVFDVDYILIKAAGLNSTVVTGGQTAPLNAGTDSIETTEGTAVAIPGEKLLANDSGGGGSLSVAGVVALSAQGGTVSLATNVVTYTPKAGFRGNDSFTYVLASTTGARTTGMVNVTVNAASNQSQNSVSIIDGGLGVVVVQFVGIPGRRYTIQGSLDLRTWTDLGAVTASPKGAINFIDLDGSKFPQRFYRTAP